MAARLGANAGIVTPFQIGLQARFTIGPDPVRNRLGAAFGGRRGGGAPGATGERNGTADASDFADRFARVMPNTITPILQRRDSLGLTNDQMTRLRAISDSLDTQNRALSDSLRAAIEGAGQRPDPVVLFARIRPKLAKAREHGREALDHARQVLTPEQWAKLPDNVRSPGPARRRREQ